MPRRRRMCPVDFPTHVIQRGNNRQPLFTSDADKAAYSHWLEDGALRFQVDVHGWVFMTNHVHLLITPRMENGVSRLMQSLGRRYVGHNPVRAGMVTDPGDYRWSSYRARAFGAPVKFWNPHDLYRSLASSPEERQTHWRRLVGEAMDAATIAEIRHCTNTGLVLGTEKFRDQVAALKN